jgi:hypothetical protein
MQGVVSVPRTIASTPGPPRRWESLTARESDREGCCPARPPPDGAPEGDVVVVPEPRDGVRCGRTRHTSQLGCHALRP